VVLDCLVNYKFTGQEYDGEIALHNFRARLYDSEAGIFYAMDPARQIASPFGYAGGNPIINVDPDGEFFLEALQIATTAYSIFNGYINGGREGAIRGAALSAVAKGFSSYLDGAINLGNQFHERAIARGLENAIQGGVNTAIAGGNPIKGAVIGGATGAVLGGVSSLLEPSVESTDRLQLANMGSGVPKGYTIIYNPSTGQYEYTYMLDAVLVTPWERATLWQVAGMIGRNIAYLGMDSYYMYNIDENFNLTRRRVKESPEVIMGMVPPIIDGPASPNQINKLIRTGKAPKGLKRVDVPRTYKEKIHMTFDNGNALNIDGTWKHIKGSTTLTNAQKKFLRQHGWKILE
jgi:RHS repeat-associated protein